MNEITEVDDQVFAAMNEMYDNQFSDIKFRGAFTDGNSRHYSFGCTRNDNTTVGVHVYLNIEKCEIDHIYESEGETP